VNRSTLISIPTLVRVKPGALSRLGIYFQRAQHRRVLILASEGLPEEICNTARQSLQENQIEVVGWINIQDNSFERAALTFRDLPSKVDAVVGLGGGKALDVAKYIAFLARLPYYAVPSSLSNDGLCSPQSSLTIAGKRRSLSAALPHGVVIDVAVCLAAPRILWQSGVGDLAAKLTSVFDWKLAFHHKGEPVDDFAALLSDATVHQFMARPDFDLTGTSLLGTALLLNGVAMEICGSSRPASGSEHLISHALDSLSERPRLHGLQVGLAAYMVSQLQQQRTSEIAELFDRTDFWSTIASDPFSRREWLEAVRIAPTIKNDFFTVLSLRDCVPEIERIIDTDPRLAKCFHD
jgi:glycerol-1-phosphate dehydrogenase [NAD(P)+]